MKPTDEQIAEFRAKRAEQVRLQRQAYLAGNDLDRMHQEWLLQYDADADERFDVLDAFELKPRDQCATPKP